MKVFIDAAVLEEPLAGIGRSTLGLYEAAGRLDPAFEVGRDMPRRPLLESIRRLAPGGPRKPSPANSARVPSPGRSSRRFSAPADASGPRKLSCLPCEDMDLIVAEGWRP
jgi:hypothetical protein